MTKTEDCNGVCHCSPEIKLVVSQCRFKSVFQISCLQVAEVFLVLLTITQSLQDNRNFIHFVVLTLKRV